MRMFNIPNKAITPATMKPIPPATPNPHAGSARLRSAQVVRASADPVVMDAAGSDDAQPRRPRTPQSLRVETGEASATRTPPRTPEHARRPRSRDGEHRPRSGDSERRPRTGDKQRASRIPDGDDGSHAHGGPVRDSQDAQSHCSRLDGDTRSPRRPHSTTSPRSVRASTADAERERPRTATATSSARSDNKDVSSCAAQGGAKSNAGTPRSARAHRSDEDARTPRRPRSARAVEGSEKVASEEQGGDIGRNQDIHEKQGEMEGEEETATTEEEETEYKAREEQIDSEEETNDMQQEQMDSEEEQETPGRGEVEEDRGGGSQSTR